MSEEMKSIVLSVFDSLILSLERRKIDKNDKNEKNEKKGRNLQFVYSR